jgi:hypothetical protein
MTTVREQVSAVESAWCARLTTRYVADVVNHVAAVHVAETFCTEGAAGESLRRFLAWRSEGEGRWAGVEYCEFAAFFAFELARGPLGEAAAPCTRFRVALDFVTHVILEGNLASRVWRVEYDLREALAVLLTSEGTPDLMLETFRVSRW